MNKDFEKVYAAFEVSINDLVRIPKENLKEIISRRLSMEIASFIEKNINDLPVLRKVRIDKHSGSETHLIKFNLISDQEYKRLKEVESRYYDLLPRGFEG